MTESATKKIPEPKLVKGMKDIVPADRAYWDAMVSQAERLSADFGFERIDVPVLEETSLFVRGIGKQTEVVEKQMFSFKDLGSASLSLRPEFTAGIARAYIEHGMLNIPQPVKLYTWGPLFRREKPQAGRYRQFHQFDVEVLGDAQPVVDAEVILLGYQFLLSLGIAPIVHINSIGSKACRMKYKQLLIDYYRPKRKHLPEEYKKTFTKNPLRLLDANDEKLRELRVGAPQIVDHLDDESKQHLMKVLEFLDELDIPYMLDPYIVRGLDYYNRTTFEFFVKDESHEKAQSALGGGGRYDGLLETLGGRPTPAVGFAIGMERVMLKLREMKTSLSAPKHPRVFLAQLGEQSKKKAIALFQKLLVAGIPVMTCFTKDNLKTQLEIANKKTVAYTLILGQKELMDGTILVRDMEGGVQETVNMEKIVPEMKKRLKIDI